MAIDLPRVRNVVQVSGSASIVASLIMHMVLGGGTDVVDASRHGWAGPRRQWRHEGLARIQMTVCCTRTAKSQQRANKDDGIVPWSTDVRCHLIAT